MSNNAEPMSPEAFRAMVKRMGYCEHLCMPESCRDCLRAKNNGLHNELDRVSNQVEHLKMIAEDIRGPP